MNASSKKIIAMDEESAVTSLMIVRLKNEGTRTRTLLECVVVVVRRRPEANYRELLEIWL